jgi:hypothetical protein
MTKRLNGRICCGDFGSGIQLEVFRLEMAKKAEGSRGSRIQASSGEIDRYPEKPFELGKRHIEC